MLCNIAHSYILRKAHLVAQIILENNSGVAAQIHNIVFPQINTIQQNIALFGIV